MFATANSKVCFHMIGRSLMLAGVAVVSAVCADSSNTDKARWVARAAEVYAATQKRFEADPTNAVAAWEFARAAFDRAELATNDTERATLARLGIEACRGALMRAPRSAAAHYYLGMNLGKLADTKRNLSAFKIVKEMEREFEAVRDLDKEFDFAGADRNLGLLYEQAPAVISVGSRSKARRHLVQAVALSPGYPENRLNLGEAAVRWRDLKTAQRELAALEELWSKAREKLAGVDWEASWADWSSRLTQLRIKVKELSKPITSPRASD